MSEITLSGLYFYPVKSLAGISLERAPVDRRGIRFDRHWMLVDSEGCFLTQRQRPEMARIKTQLAPGLLRLSAPDMPDLDLELEGEREKQLTVEVWNDRVEAQFEGARVSNWLSQYLGVDCRLVSMPAKTVRPVDPRFARSDDQVGFSDGFPFLLISEGSLEDLNSRLDTPMTMRRFRPNLVVKGCEPYAEDQWKRIRIGDMTFRVVKPCSRCVITTIEPETLEKGPEPLRTLSQYRREGNKVYFGQNVIHDSPGELKLGMPVEILE